MQPQIKRGRGRPPKKSRLKICQGINPSRFFKIILPAILQHNSLRLPQKFSSTFRSQLSRVAKAKATLILPTGVASEVAIELTDDNKIYFTHGWGEFMERNRIKYGYFLVFEYMGNLQFKVHIFDLSCCEIDYPRNTSNTSCVKAEEEAIPPLHITKSENPEEEAIPPLHITKSENPFFTAVVRNHSLPGKWNYMHVPNGFAKKYMGGKSRSSYGKLRVEDGREWVVRCQRMRKTRRTDVKLSGCGWKNFSLDYNLKEGESYVFELVGEEDDYVVFKVFKNA